MKSMAKELIPELHDVLKITTLQHNFSDFDDRFLKYSPSTLSWKGVQQHHCKKEKENEEGFLLFPTDRDTFLLHIADILASGFSRHQQSYKGEADFILHKLWNPDWQGKDLRLKGEGQIIDLLKFLSQDPGYAEFQKRYGEILTSRAEDARPGMNITSLETHLTLTGKFYRFLRNSNTLIVTDDEIIPSAQEIFNLTESKSKSWHIYLTRCKFRFNQKPARARDLSVLGLLDEVISGIEKDYYDNILYATSDEIMLLLDDRALLDTVNAIAISHGMWVMIYQDGLTLEETRRFFKRPRVEGKHVYPTLLPTIKPPICEVCQMSEGARTWPMDYYARFGKEPEAVDEGVEYLCENCFSIRSRPSRLKQLQGWTEAGGSDVLWVKVRLDYESLTTTLQKLYLEYLRRCNPSAKNEDAEIRFSLISEFYKDYDYFLSTLRDSLLERFGGSRLEFLLKDLFCLRSDRKGDIFLFLQEFNRTLDLFFPELKKFVEGPIGLSLVYCRSKFPFFDVWRMMEDQTGSLRISLIGHGSIESSLKYLDDILLAGTQSYRRSALHKLAEISETSEKLAELKFQDRSERGDFESYEALRRKLLPLGMDFSSLLNFARLLGD
jgi:hypothetical protein